MLSLKLIKSKYIYIYFDEFHIYIYESIKNRGHSKSTQICQCETQ